MLTLILFLARGVIAGLFQAIYMYTPQAYPTSLRSVGVGGCSSLARLGAMCTPYVRNLHYVCVNIFNSHLHHFQVAQVLFQTSVWSAVSVYGIFAVIASIACLFLPYDPRGSDLTQ
jgi:hypothetical protein